MSACRSSSVIGVPTLSRPVGFKIARTVSHGWVAPGRARSVKFRAGWALAAVMASMVGTACDTEGTASPSATVAATTLPAPTTTAAAVSTVAPTTTEAGGLSRDARLALSRCWDALGPFLAELATLGGTDLEDAKVLCEDAKLQVEVDGGDAQLVVALAEVNLTLAFAKLDQLTGSIDAASLQAEIDRHSRALAKWID
jgi:hypothetical protein